MDSLYQIYSDPEIVKYIEGLYEDRLEECHYIEDYRHCMYEFYGYGIWTIIEKESGAIIGRAGIANREIDGELSKELGYVIGMKYQNRGFATEILRSVISFAREKLYLEQLRCVIDRENKKSIHLAEKLGFQMEFQYENSVVYILRL